MVFDTTLLLFGILPGLVIGLVLGWLLGGTARAGRRQALAERDAAVAERDAARLAQADAERQAAQARDQIAPLADEVERLRRDGRARPVVPASPAPPVAQFPPTEKLPLFIETPPLPPDHLGLIKGIGPRLEAMLHETGVHYFHQIANWSPEDVRLVDAKLDQFKGRIERDQWIEQAKLIATGRITEYEARFGKLGQGDGAQ